MEDKTLLLQTIMDKAVANNEMAGVTMLFRENGEEKYYLESGYADRENGVKISRDNIFRLYSASKPITGAAVMKLFEEGALDIGQPVEDYIPGFKDVKVAEGDTIRSARNWITIKNLLDMTSGLTYGGVANAAERHAASVAEEEKARQDSDNPMTTLEFASRMAEGPIAFDPGTKFRYGTSADVLGAVIEVVTGKRFGDFLEDEFFAPLGMKDTGFYVPEEKLDRFAVGYKRTPDGLLVPVTPTGEVKFAGTGKRPAYESGGGGMVSTIDDYAKFAQMMLNGGELDGVRILHPETIKFMTAGSLPLAVEPSFTENFPNMPGFTYGNQVRVMKYPGQATSLHAMGEYGWDGWMGCYFENDPLNQRTLLVMMQRINTGYTPVVRRMRDVLYRGE